MTYQQLIDKQWQNASIKDNFIFGKTMELYPNLCRHLLELILSVKISKINYPEREKTIETHLDGKGIRLDVFVEDDLNRSFDIEMQVTNSDDLAKRMRYYQGLLDIDKLKRGQHYSALDESYVIFICTFDYFHQGRYIYKFRERCDQDLSLELKDGATKIFLSSKGKIDDVDSDIKAFLKYVDSGFVSGTFVKELDVAVNSVKFNERVRHDFMTFQMALLEREMETEKRVRNEEREAVAVKMLRKGKSFDEVREFTDLPVFRIEELAKEKANANLA